MIRTASSPFLIGCADAAHQVEGGLTNDWSRFEELHPELIRDRSRSGEACDHRHRYREDIALLAGLGANAYRFSVEWARIEPEEGVIDHREIAYYRDVVAACREAGIEPCVTLFHFTLPQWLADRGGLLAPDAVTSFARYAALVTGALGDGVRWWITINEPNVLAVMAYLWGKFPPLHQSLVEALRALQVMVRMHAAGATAIRDVAGRRGGDPVISIALHVRPFFPAGISPFDRAATAWSSVLFNDIFLACCKSGRLLPPLGRGQTVPGLADSLDFLGLNHYNGERIGVSSKGIVYKPLDGVPQSALGWSIDPVLFEQLLVSLWTRWGLPIVVTENGVADVDDELRGDYLTGYVAAVERARAAGIPVLGYFQWTLMDNFEWLEGYTAHFGLYAVDRTTLERTEKPSATIFREACKRLAGRPLAAGMELLRR